jgi:hypothetical protein
LSNSKAHVVQLFFGGQQLGAEAAQVFHQHQRMFLLFEEPDRHEGREVAVVLLSRRNISVAGNADHSVMAFILMVWACSSESLAGVEAGPWNVLFHVPTHGFELLE